MGIKIRELKENIPVYDITVEDNHNFYANDILIHNCGEQPLPPEGSCLLGSVNIAKMVKNPFTEQAEFDWETYKEVVRVFTRMLDNVVELNGLPLEGQRREIEYKRRHGMGFLGLGSALSLLGEEYGNDFSIKFTEEIMKVMAVEGFREGIQLAIEKGAAPIFYDETHGISNKEHWVNGQYMNRIWKAAPELKEQALEHGCRFTHHTSIAPTGTISLSLNNNASNGIEPSFAHHYVRNVVTEGKKSKASVDVYSYEMLLYKELTGNEEVPESFSTSENVPIFAHVDIQAAAQRWCDSSISKCMDSETTMVVLDGNIYYLDELDHSEENDTFTQASHSTLDHTNNRATVSSVYNNGRVECIKIVFDDNSHITCTPNHRIYTENGWVKAKDICISENISTINA